MLNEDVSGISSQETFGRSEPSLIDFTIRSRSWLVLNEYFDSFINVNRQESFQTLGWKTAIYVLYLSNCRTKLSRLEARIKDALVNNESVKLIRKLKASRETILENFNKVKKRKTFVKFIVCLVK